MWRRWPTSTLAQRDLIESFAAQLALLVERESLRAAGEREKLLAESEKLHRALLDGVSHELKTPLAVLGSAVENLASADETTRATLAVEIRTATRRLNRLVNNLLDQTRLESGALKPRLDWCDAHDPRQRRRRRGARRSLAGHPFESYVADELPALSCRCRAHGAGDREPPPQRRAAHPRAHADFSHRGGRGRPGAGVFHGRRPRAGLPDGNSANACFRNFSEYDAARAGGLGLGLSIIRGFVAAQGGEIVVGENLRRRSGVYGLPAVHAARQGAQRVIVALGYDKPRRNSDD